MSRNSRQQRSDSDGAALPGQDSFLDIVANIVGILILLVMVVGLRAARHDPATTSTVAPAVATNPIPNVSAEQLKETLEQSITSREEFANKVRKVAAVREESAFRDGERVELTAFVAKVEQEIEERRQKMGQDQRRDFDLTSKIGTAQYELEKLTRERMALFSAEPEVKQVESLPTPLSMTVSDKELHLRLAGGHVHLLPIDALLAEAKHQFHNNLWRLEKSDRLVLSVGPIDGYRMKFRLRKYAFTNSQSSGSMVRSEGWQIEPENRIQGETVPDAVTPNSKLMSSLRRASVGKRPTITVWTYPDSYEAFRDLKAVLFERGYSVASRPLPADAKIGASPNGTKSAAQ